MIVFNLHCAGEHRFEGWFRSQEDYLAQRERELVACPVCGNTRIERLPTAPRLNLSKPSEPVAADQSAPQPNDAADLAAGLRQIRRLLGRAEDVGERFAQEARRIHYDEAPARSIRGKATRSEFSELVEEGISALPLPADWLPDGGLN